MSAFHSGGVTTWGDTSPLLDIHGYKVRGLADEGNVFSSFFAMG
jgi:hypothetical protein